MFREVVAMKESQADAAAEMALEGAMLMQEHGLSLKKAVTAEEVRIVERVIAMLAKVWDSAATAPEKKSAAMMAAEHVCKHNLALVRKPR